MKRQTKLIVFMASFWFNIQVNGQSIEQGSRVIMSSSQVRNAKYYVYDPPLKTEAIYKSLSEAKNNFPEQLMISILCATSQEWVNHNTYGGEENSEQNDDLYYQEVKENLTKGTYYELYSKLTFEAIQSEMAIVKFGVHNEGPSNQPLMGVMVMIRVDGVWKRTSTPFTNKIALALLLIKPKIMDRLLKKEGMNDKENDLINKVYNREGFDFESLSQELLRVDESYFMNELNWKE